MVLREEAGNEEWEKPDASEKEVDGEVWMAEIGWIRWL